MNAQTIKVKTIKAQISCLVVLWALCATTPVVWAKPTSKTAPRVIASPETAALETTLYGTVFSAETDAERLSRIERHVFGKPAPEAMSVAERLARVVPVVVQPPKRLSRLLPKTEQEKAEQAVEKPLPGESDYPVVRAMEQKLLGKAYPTLSLEARLKQLEQKRYGQPKTGSLMARTDALRVDILGAQTVVSQKPPQTASPAEWNDYYGPKDAAVDPAPDNTQSENEQIQQLLAQVEQTMLKQQYPYEPVEARLSRLEMATFNQQAPPDMPPSDRLQRLIAVAQGHGTLSDVRKAQRDRAMGQVRSVLPLLLMLLPLLL